MRAVLAADGSRRTEHLGEGGQPAAHPDPGAGRDEHVVLPEFEMGERVAHLVTGRILSFIESEDDYALDKTKAPNEAIDRTLADSALRGKYGVTVVSIKRPGEDFTYATADTTVYTGDVLIVAGRTRDVEAFADLSSA